MYVCMCSFVSSKVANHCSQAVARSVGLSALSCAFRGYGAAVCSRDDVKAETYVVNMMTSTSVPFQDDSGKANGEETILWQVDPHALNCN